MESAALEAIVYHEDPSQLTRRERKKLRRELKRSGNNIQGNFKLTNIEPITENQQRMFDSYLSGKNLLLHGVAGTGKTFISLFLSLRDVIENYDDKTKVVIVRSIVPTRDMGFLPGNAKEKSKVYEAPYYAICNELFGRGDAYDVVKGKNQVEFLSTSYVRGTTLNDCIVVVDECQNLTFHELDSIITRIGRNCRIIFCGDFRQTDLWREGEKRGILDFIKVVKNMNSFDLIEFDEEDIVRSDLVKEYILSKLKHGIST